MAYKSKLWLDSRCYLAVLDEALVLVKLDEHGEECKWSIYMKDGEHKDKVFRNEIRKGLD